jgi:hypothetical protein
MGMNLFHPEKNIDLCVIGIKQKECFERKYDLLFKPDITG